MGGHDAQYKEQTMTEYVSDSYAEPPPARRGATKRLIIVSIVVLLVCGLAGAAVCFGPYIVMALSGQSISNEFEDILLQTVCSLENPDLSEQTCQVWAEQVSRNHPGLYTECSSSSAEESDIYQCILDAGVDPPQ
jgi:hypothetical protein